MTKTTGSIFNGKLFRIIYRQDGAREKPFAVVVSTKISKKAVVRNKIRRRLQEATRLLLPNIHFGNYTIYAKKEIVQENFFTIKQELAKAFNINTARL